MNKYDAEAEALRLAVEKANKIQAVWTFLFLVLIKSFQ